MAFSYKEAVEQLVVSDPAWPYCEYRYKNNLTNVVGIPSPLFVLCGKGSAKDGVVTGPPLPVTHCLWLIVIENSISTPAPERQSDSGA